jgi:hypothetical protein
MTSDQRSTTSRLGLIDFRFVPRNLAYTLVPAIHMPAHLAFSVPALLKIASSGILTGCPSTSPFGYALGID